MVKIICQFLYKNFFKTYNTNGMGKKTFSVSLLMDIEIYNYLINKINKLIEKKQ